MHESRDALQRDKPRCKRYDLTINLSRYSSQTSTRGGSFFYHISHIRTVKFLIETFDFTTLKLSTYLYDLYGKIIFNTTIIDSFYLGCHILFQVG
jgi:hypothetical protein